MWSLTNKKMSLPLLYKKEFQVKNHLKVSLQEKLTKKKYLKLKRNYKLKIRKYQITKL